MERKPTVLKCSSADIHKYQSEVASRYIYTAKSRDKSPSLHGRSDEHGLPEPVVDVMNRLFTNAYVPTHTRNANDAWYEAVHRKGDEPLQNFNVPTPDMVERIKCEGINSLINSHDNILMFETMKWLGVGMPRNLLDPFPTNVPSMSPRSKLLNPSPAESLYRWMVPAFNQYVVVLLKLLLAAAPSVNPYVGVINLRKELDLAKKQTPGSKRASTTSMTTAAVDIVDFERHKQIVVKAISAILLLLAKYFRQNRTLRRCCVLL